MVFMALIVILSTLKNRLAVPVKWIWQPFICQWRVKLRYLLQRSTSPETAFLFTSDVQKHQRKWRKKVIFRQKATPLSSGSSAPPSLTRLPFSSARTSFSLGWWLQDTDGQRTGMDRGHRDRRQRTRMAAPPVTASVKVTARLYRAETIDGATKGRVTNPNSGYNGVPF